MVDLLANSSADRKLRPEWLALAALVAAHCAFNLFFDPTGTPADDLKLVGLPLIGASIAQPILLAIWAASAGGHAAVRIPLTLAASALLFFASTIKTWNHFTSENVVDVGEQLMIYVIFLGILLAIMTIVRLITGWRIATRTFPASAV